MKKNKNDRCQQLMDIQSKYAIQCCKCGRKELILSSQDKVLCSWCGNYIYRNKKLEFADRLNTAIKRGASV